MLLRGFSCASAKLERADGSAEWTQGRTCVTAAVYGPGQFGLARNEDPEQLTVEVHFRPRAGLPGQLQNQCQTRRTRLIKQRGDSFTGSSQVYYYCTTDLRVLSLFWHELSICAGIQEKSWGLTVKQTVEGILISKLHPRCFVKIVVQVSASSVRPAQSLAKIGCGLRDGYSP